MLGPQNTTDIPQDALGPLDQLPWFHPYRQTQSALLGLSMARHTFNTLDILTPRHPLTTFLILNAALATDARVRLTTHTDGHGTRYRVLDFTDGSSLTINAKTGRAHIFDISEPLSIINMGELA
jgi:hypothetical protein